MTRDIGVLFWFLRFLSFCFIFASLFVFHFTLSFILVFLGLLWPTRSFLQFLLGCFPGFGLRSSN